MDKVGLIGVGLLGSAIAERLTSNKIEVIVFDSDADRLTALADSGGQVAEDATAVVAACPTIILSLPTSVVSTAVLKETSDSLQPGQFVVDTTTGKPNEMVANADRLATRHVHYVEAMVAGSSQQLRRGEANLFVGGNTDSIARLNWLWPILSRQHFCTGLVGTASKFKLVHNHVLGLHRLVLAEALSLAEALGFSGRQALNILQQSPAASAVMANKGEKMVHRDLSPEARLAQHLKDVKLIIDQANHAGAHIPLARLHRQILEQAVELGLGEADNSAVMETFRQAHSQRAGRAEDTDAPGTYR